MFWIKWLMHRLTFAVDHVFSCLARLSRVGVHQPCKDVHAFTKTSKSQCVRYLTPSSTVCRYKNGNHILHILLILIHLSKFYYYSEENIVLILHLQSIFCCFVIICFSQYFFEYFSCFFPSIILRVFSILFSVTFLFSCVFPSFCYCTCFCKHFRKSPIWTLKMRMEHLT